MLDGPFDARDGELFLTEGGIETEIMYKWGYELPHFAMFPLLENPPARAAIAGMLRRYLDVAAGHGMSAFFTGLDYRASPDWGRLLGYSPASLRDANIAAIAFLRELAKDYAAALPRVLVGGILGPRGDAYALNRTITADEAEDYHSVQLETLQDSGAEFACAMTLNNVPEAVGIVRAARGIGLPLAMSLTLDTTARLKSGPALGEAIEAIDRESGGGPAFYLLNCSHPVEFEPALTGGLWTARIRGFRPNASKMEKIALCKLGYLEEGDPVELGHMIGDLAARFPHLDVFGGCCGTGAVHLDKIARNVCAVRRRPVPA